MALTLTNLKKTYVAPDGTFVPVVNIAKLRIETAEQAALIGSSGSGKTTLLHMIAGILAPDSGSIVFEDTSSTGSTTTSAAANAGEPLSYYTGKPNLAVDITQLSEARRDIFRGANVGYVFQTHHLLSGFTALENVLLGMSFTGRPHDPEWGRHLLKEVGLADRLNYKPEKLSVGQQQRVAVARALANRPRLVLADEPTGALDPKNAQHVLELVRNLCREVGASLMLVTHDLSIAGQLPRVLNLSEINSASTAYAGKSTAAAAQSVS